MPRFTTTTILASTAMVLIGAAMLVCMVVPLDAWKSGRQIASVLGSFGLMGGSGALIGAGVLLPFKRPVIGFLLGVLIQFAVIGIMLLRLKD